MRGASKASCTSTASGGILDAIELELKPESASVAKPATGQAGGRAPLSVAIRTARITPSEAELSAQFLTIKSPAFENESMGRNMVCVASSGVTERCTRKALPSLLRTPTPAVPRATRISAATHPLPTTHLALIGIRPIYAHACGVERNAMPEVLGCNEAPCEPMAMDESGAALAVAIA